MTAAHFRVVYSVRFQFRELKRVTSGTGTDSEIDPIPIQSLRSVRFSYRVPNVLKMQHDEELAAITLFDYRSPKYKSCYILKSSSPFCFKSSFQIQFHKLLSKVMTTPTVLVPFRTVAQWGKMASNCGIN